MIIRVHNNSSISVRLNFSGGRGLNIPPHSVREVKNANKYDLNVVKNQARFGIMFSVVKEPAVVNVKESESTEPENTETEELIEAESSEEFVISEGLVARLKEIDLENMKIEDLRNFVKEFNIPCNGNLPKYYLYKQVAKVLKEHGVV